MSRGVQGLNMIKDILGYNEVWTKEDNVVMTDQAYPRMDTLFLRSVGLALSYV